MASRSSPPTRHSRTPPPRAQPSNALRANGNVYIDANEPLGNNAILTTVALQNRIDQNGDGLTSGRAAGPDANPEFSGEIAVSMCGVTDQTPDQLRSAGRAERLVVRGQPAAQRRHRDERRRHR